MQQREWQNTTFWMKAQSDGHELKTVTFVDGMADRPNGELKFVTDMRKVRNNKEASYLAGASTVPSMSSVEGDNSWAISGSRNKGRTYHLRIIGVILCRKNP